MSFKESDIAIGDHFRILAKHPDTKQFYDRIWVVNEINHAQHTIEYSIFINAVKTYTGQESIVTFLAALRANTYARNILYPSAENEEKAISPLIPHRCHCDWVRVMRLGCKCGGI
jgi:hypothetical protein